jgi:uncharacterized membrane protein YdjX (TVP38/TMEM64 family)
MSIKIIKTISTIIISLIFIGGLLYINSLQLLDIEKMQSVIKNFGVYGPLVFMAMYIGISLMGISAASLTILAGLLFDLPTAMITVVISATIAAYIAFVITRYFSQYITIKNANIQKFIDQIEEKSEKNGFLVISTLRLTFLPYILLSYAAGFVKKLKATDFVLATFFTNIFGSFFFIYLGFSVTQSLPFFIGAIVLLILFLQTPKIMKKLISQK